MTIKNICKTDIVTIERTALLKKVSGLMQSQHVGCVVVVDALDGKKLPVGIITDRDIALVLGSSSKPQDLLVEHIMQSAPITVNKTDGIFETILKMRVNGVKRVPVIDDSGALYGIICADDILELMAEEVSNLSKINDVQVKKERGVRMPTERSLQI